MVVNNNLKYIIKEGLEDKFKEKLFDQFTKMKDIKTETLMNIFNFTLEEANIYQSEYKEYLVKKIESGEIVELAGDLNYFSKIKTLGNLKYIGGEANFLGSNDLTTLGNLEYVGGDLIAPKSIKSLGNLKYVGGGLNLRECIYLNSLGNLKYVGGFLNIYNMPLSHKKDQIRKMIGGSGKITNDYHGYS